MELVSSLIFIPLLSLPFFYKFRSKAKFIALLTPALQMLLAIALTSLFPVKEYYVLGKIPWFSFGNTTIYYAIGWDATARLMVFLTLILLFFAILASPKKIKDTLFYYTLLMLLDVSLLGSFLAADYFLFYVFFEFMLIPMYFLIGNWGGKKRIYATLKFFIYTFIGSLLILGGIFALFSMHDSLEFVSLKAQASQGTKALKTLAFFLLFTGFAVKLPLFPLHNWLPTAHVEASTPISMLLAGVLLKVGGYGILRWVFPFFPENVAEYKTWLDIVAVISILWGGLAALGQNDLKRLIAYSSVAHMGYVILGLTAMNPQGEQGAVLQLFFHGFISAGLFYLVGILYSRTNTREISALSGLLKKTPRLSGITAAYFFAGSGFPPFGLFVAEFGILTGAYKSGTTLGVLLIALTGILVSTLYFFKTYSQMFLGEFHAPKEFHDLHKKEVIIQVGLLAFVLFGGLFPSLFL